MAVKRVTLKDIAEASGYSITTVTCAVNERPNGKWNIIVRPEVREEIKAIAERMGYRPNTQARTLRTGKSSVVGIITPWSSNPLDYERVSRLTRGIISRGYENTVYEIGRGDPSQVRRVLDMLSDQQVCGIILSQLGITTEDMERVQSLAQSGMPIVELSSFSHGDIPFFGTDYYRATHDMAETLIRRGRKNIVVVCASNFETNPYAIPRLGGIRDACAEAGVSFKTFPKLSPVSDDQIREGVEATIELMRSHKPDVVFYMNDYLALAGLYALRTINIRVPQDLYVCGFDGLEVTSVSNPTLTTAEQPIEQIADAAVESLFEIIEGRADISRRGNLFPCKLVFRESTGD